MTTTSASLPRGATGRWQPSEDWLATIIGLAIVLIIGSGLLGPGPQNVGLRAAEGETKTAAALPLSGWRVSASLDGESAAIENSVAVLEAGRTYAITCAEGVISAQPLDTLPEGVSAPPDGRAQLVATNNCPGELSITYRTNAAIPWPIFNLFNR